MGTREVNQDVTGTPTSRKSLIASIPAKSLLYLDGADGRLKSFMKDTCVEEQFSFASESSGVWSKVEDIDVSGVASWTSPTLVVGAYYLLVVHHWLRDSSSTRIDIRVHTGGSVDIGVSDYAYNNLDFATSTIYRNDAANDEIRVGSLSQSVAPTRGVIQFGQVSGQQWWCHSKFFYINGSNPYQSMGSGLRLSTSDVQKIVVKDGVTTNVTFKGTLWKLDPA